MLGRRGAPEFEPIEITSADDSDVRVVAELVEVLTGT